jgi:hypothetical protein
MYHQPCPKLAVCREPQKSRERLGDNRDAAASIRREQTGKGIADIMGRQPPFNLNSDQCKPDPGHDIPGEDRGGDPDDHPHL